MKSISHLDERGNVAVITGLSLAILTGSAGMATIYVQSMNAEEAVQHSLDAAVLAATAMTTGTPDGRRISMAKKVFEFNLEEATKKGEVVFVVTEKPEFLVNQTEVTGRAKGRVENTLGAALGITEMNISASATAKKMSSDPLCILALNNSQPASIQLYGNAQINAHDCPMQANSKNGQGLKLTGSKSSASASMIGVTGGYSGENWTPKPTTGTEPVDDPYASLPVPEPDGCMAVSGKLTSKSFTLDPGTYCGGLNIGAGATVTLNPGIYVMRDGALAVGSGASVSGTEVMFAFVGANSVLDMRADSTVTLTSPSTGTYKNMQFMSDRDVSDSKANEEWTSILSGATLEYDGVMYLPEQQIWASGTGHDIVIKANSPSLAIVADSIWAQGNVRYDITQKDKRGIGGVQKTPGIAYGAMLAD